MTHAPTIMRPVSVRSREPRATSKHTVMLATIQEAKDDLESEEHTACDGDPGTDGSLRLSTSDTLSRLHFPVVKTFRLTFLRMRNKCKIISIQRNNKAFSA